MENNNVSRNGLTFAGLLTIVFIVLKLIGVIDWSWWIVICPILIEISVALIVLFVVLLFLKSGEKKKSED